LDPIPKRPKIALGPTAAGSKIALGPAAVGPINLSSCCE